MLAHRMLEASAGAHRAAAIPGGYSLRLIADDLALSNGAAVANWAARTGPDATQSNSADRPVFIDAAHGPNGNSAVRFDGSKTFLSGSALGISGQAAFTFIAVMCRSGTASLTYQDLFQFGDVTAGNGGASVGCCVDSATNTSYGSGFRFNNGARIFSPMITSTLAVGSWQMLDNDTYASAAWDYNGSPGSQVGIVNGTNTLNLTDGGYLVGCGNNSSGNLAFAAVDVCEMVLYPSALSSAALTSAVNALMGSYGI